LRQSELSLPGMRPIVLAILDGWGYSKQKIGNAILKAQTPNINYIGQNYPSLLLQASGKAVGMTWGEPGNSEVGHLTIGAGRIIFQYMSRINKAIESGAFFENPVLLEALEHIKKNNSKLHIAGLLTSGSVHAYLGHISGLMNFAKKNNIDLKIHLFTDGKDSGLKEATSTLKKAVEYMKSENGTGQIATVIGRDYAMDRNKNWDLTAQTYDLLTQGVGEDVSDVSARIERCYAEGITDGKIPPLVADRSGLIGSGDALIFFNFREDSMRQIARSFVEDDFNAFPRSKVSNLFVAGMTQYFEHPSLKVMFPMPTIENGLTEALSKAGINQLHIAETEKYAHVTYFFNCLQDRKFPGEVDLLIESVKNPGNQPEMKAQEILARAVEELNKDFYEFMVINFANADILAHQGNFDKVVMGVEAIDKAIGALKDAVLAKNGILVITADHGNAESVVYHGSGSEETKHDPNPVPFHLIVGEYQRLRSDGEIAQSFSDVKGVLADVAPTILEIMGIEKPAEMTGESLIRNLS